MIDRDAGLDRKASGKAFATTRQDNDATMVVIKTPNTPELKTFCTPSLTPNIFSFTEVSNDIIRAMENWISVWNIWRPTKKASTLLPRKTISQFRFAIG